MDNRLRLSRGAMVKLRAIRKAFGLGSDSEAADQAISVYSDGQAKVNPLYAKMLDQVAQEAMSEMEGR
jgi:hypothetical protein